MNKYFTSSVSSDMELSLPRAHYSIGTKGYGTIVGRTSIMAIIGKLGSGDSNSISNPFYNSKYCWLRQIQHLCYLMLRIAI